MKLGDEVVDGRGDFVDVSGVYDSSVCLSEENPSKLVGTTLPRDLSDSSGDASVGASEMPKGGKLICALKNSDQSEKLELAVF